MGIQMSTSELSSDGLSEMSDADEPDDRRSYSSVSKKLPYNFNIITI